MKRLTNSLIAKLICPNAPGFVTVKVVPNWAYSAYDMEVNHVLRELRTVANGRVDYDLQYVDEILHDGGKIWFIVYSV